MIRVLEQWAAPAGFGFAVLAVWEALVQILAIPPYLLPGPVLIVEKLVSDRDLLGMSLLFTLKVTVLALIAAVLGGGGLALAFAQSRLLQRMLLPYAIILQVTPVVAIAPLIIIWVNQPLVALLICAWIVAFFPILSNTMVGLNSADPNLGALFTLYGATSWQRLAWLRMPAALPLFLAGLRISGGLSLIGAIVAEFVAGVGGRETGLAYRILEAGNRLDIARMFAALVLISLSGIAIYGLLSALSSALLRHWHDSAIEGAE